MMSKRDFKLLARTIGYSDLSVVQKTELGRQIASVCAISSTRFDPDQFLKTVSEAHNFKLTAPTLSVIPE